MLDDIKSSNLRQNESILVNPIKCWIYILYIFSVQTAQNLVNPSHAVRDLSRVR